MTKRPTIPRATVAGRTVATTPSVPAGPQADIQAGMRELQDWANINAKWRAASRAYMAHHMGCPDCIARGRTIAGSIRCKTGRDLFRAYRVALHSEPEMSHPDKSVSENTGLDQQTSLNATQSDVAAGQREVL